MSVSAPPTLDTAGLASWREVSASALRHNVTTLRALAGTAKLGVVVKADAYGHGLAPTCAAFVDAGADWLIVNFAHEATAARAAVSPELPLYVCGTVFPHDAPALVEARARVVLYDPLVAEALAAASRARGLTTPVHLKIETGTHRQGLAVADALALAERVRALGGLTLEGVTTHFADIEDSTDHRFAHGQLAALHEAQRALTAAGHAVPMVHAANSAATILDERTRGDLVRVGIAAYGLWPSKETLAAFSERHGRAPPTLRPVLSWRARLAQVKDVPAGAFVGYGRSFRTTRPSRIGVLPIGYHEGYDRRLSNVAHVLVRGLRAPVRGRVCMNMSMVDLSDVPGACAGDVATLLGSDGDERVSAEQLASWMGSIHYEVVARIHGGQRALLAG
ncbi:MAG: alanine racemase [Deltaproteobacteria bacterium]|nr:alanine racemase [Deltaproteobacteria bacterium]